MPRRKKVPLKPWETKKPDGIEARYIRLGDSLLMSTAVKKLSSSAFRVYVYMCIESGGHSHFTFPYSRYKQMMSKPTFFRALEQLVNAGFITVVAHNKNLRTANEYAFSNDWKSR